MKTSVLMAATIALAFAFAGPAQANGDAAAGEKLAKKCAACHGKEGEGKKENPALAGMAEGAFIQSMADYKSGKKENKAMNKTAEKLSDEDVANLAAYYASLK